MPPPPQTDPESAEIAVLQLKADRNEQRIYALECDNKTIRTEFAAEMKAMRNEFNALNISFQVLQTKVGMYAAAGSLVGGSVMVVITAVVMKFLNL